MGLFDFFKKTKNDDINKEEEILNESSLEQDEEQEPIITSNSDDYIIENLGEQLIESTLEEEPIIKSDNKQRNLNFDEFTKIANNNTPIQIIEFDEQDLDNTHNGHTNRLNIDAVEIVSQISHSKITDTIDHSENIEKLNSINELLENDNVENSIQSEVFIKEALDNSIHSEYEHSVDEHIKITDDLSVQHDDIVTNLLDTGELIPNISKEDKQNSIENIFEQTTQEQITEDTTKPKESLFAKMKKGLVKTKSNFTSSIDNVFKAFTSIDDDFYDELEETLILSDLGAKTSMDIIETLRNRVKTLKIKDTNEAKQVLIDIITEILNKDESPLELKSPTVILIIGVNGVGKTTTIGKLANLYKSEGKSVLLAAGDTFRAAAIEQLEEWGKRSDISVIKHAENTDSSAVIYDAIKSSQSKNTDILICDTAGRLHNKKNLMAELEKINRVINKEHPNAQLETLLVLDGTAGQNALEQAKQFNEVCNITGLVLTKLDGTAKGGIIISIKNELNIPVRYVGIGEQVNDLQTFDANVFSKALFDSEN